MLLLFSGDAVAVPLPTRAQLPLLLNMKVTLVTVAVGQASETDTARGMTVFMSVQIVQVATATETDTARAINAVIDNTIHAPVSFAEETDEALPMSHTGGVGITVVIDLVVEYDHARPIDWEKALLSPVRPPSLLLAPHTDADTLLLVPLDDDESELGEGVPCFPSDETYPGDDIYPGSP